MKQLKPNETTEITEITGKIKKEGSKGM